jgi:CHAT domain-containing protein
VLHLACHGQSDLTDPSQSYLVLARTDLDGRSIKRQDKLFVREIMQRLTSGSGIAFLRACYSADNPAFGLSDEVIHLASAFHLAGFNHVLGTLWSTRNDSCREVSETFYIYLLETNDEPSHKTVAVAFHCAVNDLRLNSLQNPLLWASFVHIGA